MTIEFRRNEALGEPRVIIEAAEETDEVRRLVRLLQSGGPAVVNGYSERGVERIPEDGIVRIYGERQKVYAETQAGRFLLRERLYELEARLNPALFVRISNSEIVNSRHILRLDASLTGTICLHMAGGTKTYASRRYVPVLRRHFGL
ncbi:MAG: LytTR family transcriptional regulator [Clostridia bacterium]|nr:LytTR family transcriptional regulator [Clostridia bacterium]MBO4886025.1 LytTR family transcriptional regulator [Clostridia bacterium]